MDIWVGKRVTGGRDRWVGEKLAVSRMVWADTIWRVDIKMGESVKDGFSPFRLPPDSFCLLCARPFLPVLPSLFSSPASTPSPFPPPLPPASSFSLPPYSFLLSLSDQ